MQCGGNMHLGLTNRGLCVVFAAAISGLLFGYDLCVVTDALEPVASAMSLTTPMTAAIVSSAMGGAAIGAIVGGPVADAFGRKPVIVASAACFVIGAAIAAIADTFEVLLFGRVVLGIAIGASGMVVSVYMAELSPPNARGMIVTVNEVAICMGCLLALGTGVVFGSDGDSWRWMFGLGCLPATVLLCLSVFLPQSPLWLARQGHTKAALKSVWMLWENKDAGAQYIHSAVDAALRAMALSSTCEAEKSKMLSSVGANSVPDVGSSATDGGDTVPPAVSHTGGEGKAASEAAANKIITSRGLAARAATSAASARGEAGPNDDEALSLIHSKSAELQRVYRPSGCQAIGASFLAIWQVFRGDAVGRKMLFVAIFIGMGQNLAFSNSVLYYAEPLLSEAGLPADTVAHVLVGMGVAKLVGVVLGMALVDRVGRRQLLLYGTLAQSVCAGAMAVAFSTASSDVRAWAVAAIMFTFIVLWDVSWAPLLWVVTSELVPAEARAAGSGLAIGSFWLSGMGTNQLLLVFFRGIGGPATLAIVCCSALVCATIVWAVLPETKGLALDDIRALFETEKVNDDL